VQSENAQQGLSTLLSPIFAGYLVHFVSGSNPDGATQNPARKDIFMELDNTVIASSFSNEGKMSREPFRELVKMLADHNVRSIFRDGGQVHITFMGDESPTVVITDLPS
jgi:hypothetical protein